MHTNPSVAVAPTGRLSVVICCPLPRRLLLYGRYCSQVETATKHLDKLSNMREDIKMKLEVRMTRMLERVACI